MMQVEASETVNKDVISHFMLRLVYCISETVNKDVISHFVLRLVYCIEEELRKWFLFIESSLFCYRFQLETPEAQRALLVEFDLPYKAVSSAEYESIKEKLNQVVRSNGQSLSNGRKQGAASLCAACKLLRWRCTQDCVFSPYFPADEPHKFASFHKVFGASNVNKMFQDIGGAQRYLHTYEA
ncbi:uncharacterized protein [Henckelia pumila]|uniref:uncharacterized protein isoform X2 n=2 Tax=Henckelia pumila TaxID=405737 RepID=UPI003C6E33B9